MDSVIFREYDIRGVYNQQFDKNFAKLLGRAFFTYLKDEAKALSPSITVGHDARISSPEISQALIEGFRSSGGDVTFIGLVTTPISYFTTFTQKVDGAIMVTGSHNPPEYNGFKISSGRSTIFGDEIQKLAQIIEREKFYTGKGEYKEANVFDEYVKRYKDEFQDLSSVKVVLDCGNGAAGCIARRLYEGLGLKPDILFEEPDGRFPNHHPDPTVAENLVDLIARVKKTGADLGIGFDGDADRIGMVNANGDVIYGDEIIALCAGFILQKQPGAKIIGDVKCSDRMYSSIQSQGGEPIMWKTGHSLIKEKIRVEKAPFGGELSGHIFFADRNYGYDDALYAGLRIIEILAETGQSVKELLEDLPPAFNTPEIRIDTTESKKHEIVTALTKEFQNDSSGKYQLNLIDGIRVSFEGGWALARASNTQPVLVLRFEAETKNQLDEIQSKFNLIVERVLNQ